MKEGRKRAGLDINALREQEKQWRGYEGQIRAYFESIPDKCQVVLQAWQGSDRGRRYFRRRMWTLYRWRLDLDPKKQGGPELPIATREDQVAYQDATRTLLEWGFLESMHNTLANAKQVEERNKRDAVPAMYDALLDFILKRVPVIKVGSLSVWNREDAIASLSGLTVAAMRQGLPSLRNALQRDYTNVQDGLLAEMTGEIALVLLDRLRRAAAGETPGDMNLEKIRLDASNAIRKRLGVPNPLPAGFLREIEESPLPIPVDQEALALIRADEMRREAQALLSPAEWEVFCLMEMRPGITLSEIAQERGVALGTIKSLDFRLRQKLLASGWKTA